MSRFAIFVLLTALGIVLCGHNARSGAPPPQDEAYGPQGWHYQPRYVIGFQGLLGSLFARADYGRYYVGDYYGSNYNRLGFVPWFDYRVGRCP